MEQQERNLLEEAKKIASQLKPGYKTRDLLDCGSGFVEESILSFSKDSCLWVAILCVTGYFAFKEVTPQWVEAYSNLILLSPQVYVEFDINHKIIAWAVVQEKFCDDDTASVKKMVRAV